MSEDAAFDIITSTLNEMLDDWVAERIHTVDLAREIIAQLKELGILSEASA